MLTRTTPSGISFTPMYKELNTYGVLRLNQAPHYANILISHTYIFKHGTATYTGP